MAGTALLLGSRRYAGPAGPRHGFRAAVIEVIARKFAFEPSHIEVTEGERVRLVVRSADGVHGVPIKKFKVNKLVPRGGDPVTIDFVASAPGTFEFCVPRSAATGHEDDDGDAGRAGKSQVTAAARDRLYKGTSL